MNAFRLRQYRPEDFPALSRLFIASVIRVASLHYTPSQIRAWAQVDEPRWRARLDNALAAIVCEEKQIAGFITLGKDGYLDMLFVHPDYLRRGIASALLAGVTLVAHKTGISRLHTEASITARPFFLDQGFRVIAQQAVTLRGENFINFAMEKWLE